VRLATGLDTFSPNQGTIRVVVQFNATATFADVQRLFQSDGGATGLTAQFDAERDALLFTDGTTNLTSAITAPTLFERRVYHFTWGRGTFAMYQNGVSLDSDTFTPNASDTYLYIGSSDSATLHGNFTIMDFTIWGQALTAAEALADYTNVVQVATDGQRVGCVPWLWSELGDDVSKNHDDTGSGDTDHVWWPAAFRAARRPRQKSSSRRRPGRSKCCRPMRSG
jgi:hypothetical protein